MPMDANAPRFPAYEANVPITILARADYLRVLAISGPRKSSIVPARHQSSSRFLFLAVGHSGRSCSRFSGQVVLREPLLQQFEGLLGRIGILEQVNVLGRDRPGIDRAPQG